MRHRTPTFPETGVSTHQSNHNRYADTDCIPQTALQIPMQEAEAYLGTLRERFMLDAERLSEALIRIHTSSTRGMALALLDRIIHELLLDNTGNPKVLACVIPAQVQHTRTPTVTRGSKTFRTMNDANAFIRTEGKRLEQETESPYLYFGISESKLNTGIVSAIKAFFKGSMTPSLREYTVSWEYLEHVPEVVVIREAYVHTQSLEGLVEVCTRMKQILESKGDV